MIVLNAENKLKLEIIYNVLSTIVYSKEIVTLNLSERYRINFTCDNKKHTVKAVFLDNDEEILKCETSENVSFFKMFYGFVNGIIVEYSYNEVVIEQDHKVIATIRL